MVSKANLGYPLAGVAGLFSGLMGAGGGLILVPVLTSVSKLGQHLAHGTSLAVMVPIASAGVVLYALRGELAWGLVGGIALGSVIGVVIGARLMMKVSAPRLRRIFGVYALVTALMMVVWG